MQFPNSTTHHRAQTLPPRRGHKHAIVSHRVWYKISVSPDALTDIGVEVDSSLIFERDFEFIEGQTAMRRILMNPDPPTAVFAANDIQAIGAIAQCREAGIDVPTDISVIGFDDLPVAEFNYPKLTTIHVPGDRMGHIAAVRLFDMIRGEPYPASEILPVEHVVRQSTARVSARQTG